MNYHVMREFADSWGLAFMFAFLILAAAVVLGCEHVLANRFYRRDKG